MKRTGFLVASASLLCVSQAQATDKLLNVTGADRVAECADSGIQKEALAVELPSDPLLGDLEHTDDNLSNSCGVWVAPSTIPGAGLGLFAGQDYATGDPFLSTGDVVLPIVDMNWYMDEKCLWREYTWGGDIYMMDSESRQVSGVSLGIGAMTNGLPELQLLNAAVQMPEGIDGAGLHRHVDPGAGAFTSYYNRHTIASRPLQAGDELLIDYGADWFTSRKGEVEQSPNLRDIHVPEGRTWSDVVSERYDLKRKAMRRSQEWLQENGVCADNVEVHRSTLRQAGRGTFATRSLQEGSIVAPVPLVHIPDRRVFELYGIKRDENGRRFMDRSEAVGHQLILNYCMGHSESTLLLCPYGIHTSMLNHNQTQANVRLQWADPAKSNHHPDWLQLSVDELGEMNRAGLAMELVAMRDLVPGEELFVDYGQEWEDAWQTHMGAWTPSPELRGAHELNQKEQILLTATEQSQNPYPTNVELKCLKPYVYSDRWKALYPDKLRHFLWGTSAFGLVQCVVTSREMDEQGQFFYTAELRGNNNRLRGVPENFQFEAPREAFQFVDRPYTSDIHLPNAFRHEAMVPDALFPEQWKNTKKGGA